MNRINFILLILISSNTYAQLHEVVIKDTSQIDYIIRNMEDTIIDYSFKNRTELSGHWIAYYDLSKDTKALEGSFNEGKLMGQEKQWYKNGNLKKESKCSDTMNLDFWEFKMWYSNGKLCMERKFEKDTCILTEFYHNGAIKQIDIEVKDSSVHYNSLIYTAEYCDNGQLKFSPFNFSSNKPEFIIGYFCNGKKKSEWTWRKGSFIGLYKEWYENGILKVNGEYGDEEAFWIQTDKIGTWLYYNSQGKLINQEKYEKGKMIEAHEFK